MNCNELTDRIDDYVDGVLDSEPRRDLEAHVADCEDCQAAIDNAMKLRKLLQEYGDSSMPTPNEAFFENALVAAARQGRADQKRRSWMTGFGSAVAAGLAIWIVSGVFFNSPKAPAVDPVVPTVTMALEEPRTINLVFSSAMALSDATLTVELPDGVEIAGFEGQQKITWLTSLQEGKNVLPLQLIGTMPADGVLLATLKHGEDDRVFRLRVEVS